MIQWALWLVSRVQQWLGRQVFQDPTAIMTGMVEMGEITRRQFIGYGAGVGAAIALPWTLGTPVASASR